MHNFVLFYTNERVVQSVVPGVYEISNPDTYSPQHSVYPSFLKPRVLISDANQKESIREMNYSLIKVYMRNKCIL